MTDLSKLTEPWQTAETPGPKKSFVIPKPEVVSAMIERAKKPILVVGHEANEVQLEEGKPIDYAIQIAEKSKVPIVSTAHIKGEFLKRGFPTVVSMPLFDIANRLRDSQWKGLDGMGQYDIALFLGIPYYMLWLALSGLKHFSSNLKTISLDLHYQPHASWSFPNMSLNSWEKNLATIVRNLGGE